MTRLSFGIAGLLAVLCGCSRSADPAAARPAPPPVPVTVATAVKGDAPVWIRTIGWVTSRSEVMLRPQIAARVSEVLIEEGTEVKAGHVLIKLDAAPYEAAVKGAEADLLQSRALATDAHNLEERNKTALASAALSQREYEQAQARAAAADADVQAKEARLQTAKLNLAYCTIAAPLDGRLGELKVKPGAIVKENETDLVEITQVHPIDVAFAIPEQNLAAVRAALSRQPLTVEAAPTGDTGAPAAGSLSFIDNQVDTTTGTIRLKGAFDNQDRRLWPGQFVNVTLHLGVDRDRIIVPESAIQSTQNGSAIFVVKPDKTVEMRVVTVLRSVGGKSIIEKGIAEGDVVVTDGQLRLSPGATVQIKTQGTATTGADR